MLRHTNTLEVLLFVHQFHHHRLDLHAFELFCLHLHLSTSLVVQSQTHAQLLELALPEQLVPVGSRMQF